MFRPRKMKALDYVDAPGKDLSDGADVDAGN